MLSLNNKVIVITGASSGIGQQCAIVCSKMGARLALFGRNTEKLSQTLGKLSGNQHLFYSLDLQNLDDFETAIAETIQRLGVITGFVHSAGIQNTLPFRLHNRDIYNNQYEINVISGFEACRIVTQKKYFNINGGSLVFISSIRGFNGEANLLGYSLSKGALLAGAKSLAIEIANRNIRVNTVSPGMVEDTDMTQKIVVQFTQAWAEKNKLEYPLGWVNTIDVANACVFLLSDESRKITGTNIIVDGGYSAK